MVTLHKSTKLRLITG